jgi:nucleoside diphosphate kinase
MKSKLIAIPYTIGIIKPHIALKDDKVDEIMKTLDQNNFEVFHQTRKILAKEEILNLFYTYRNAGFFPEI